MTSASKKTVSQTKTYIGSIGGVTGKNSFTSRYKIIEELGSGGMGTVYKVEDREIKEVIALKLLKNDIAIDEENIRRFQNELKFTRRINHKNICRMYHLSRDKNCFFITMEYVRGEDLKSIIRMMGQMSPGKTVLIAKQICEGLAEAHKGGVIHRDLKPQNIMIDKDGDVRIMDFGIARSKNAEGITAKGVMIGTPEYMSPEQLGGKDIDHRSDIYSLGVILYEMLSGRLPFEGERLLDFALKHKDKIPLTPDKLNPQIPDPLSRMVMRCLEKDREKRCQTAEDLFQELTEIEKSLPTTARVMPKGKTKVSGREGDTLVQKKRLQFAFVVLIISTALVFLSYHFARSPSKVIRTPAVKQLTFTGNAFYPALAPDGKFFAYVKHLGYGRQDVVVQDLVDRQSLVVMNTRQSNFLRWSPDSSKLSFWADTEEHGRGTFILPLLGGSPFLLEADASCLAWSPDGSCAVWSRTGEKKLHLLNYSTKNSTTLPLTGSFNILFDLEWSPKGNSLLFLALDEKNRYALWTVSLDGKIQNEILSDFNPIHSPRWSPDGKVIYYLKNNMNFKELWKLRVASKRGNVPKSSSLILAGLSSGGQITLNRDGKKLLYTKELSHSNLWQAKGIGGGQDHSPVKIQLTFGTLLNDFPSISPDGRKVAFSRGDGGTAEIYTMPVDGGIPQQITFLRSVNTAPAWSPDGDEIAFGSNHGQNVSVWKISPGDKKTARFVKTRLSGTSFSLAWAPGERILYHASNQRNVVVLDPQSEKEKFLVDDESVGWMFSPKNSPDGKKIAVHWDRSPSRGIWVISAENSSHTLIRKGDVWPVGWTADGNSIFGCEYGTDCTNIIKINLGNKRVEIVDTIPYDLHKFKQVSPHMAINEDYYIFSVIEKNSDVVMIENFDPEKKR